MNIFLHVFLGIYVRFFPKLYLLVVEYVNNKVCKYLSFLDIAKLLSKMFQLPFTLHQQHFVTSPAFKLFLSIAVVF